MEGGKKEGTASFNEGINEFLPLCRRHIPFPGPGVKEEAHIRIRWDRKRTVFRKPTIEKRGKEPGRLLKRQSSLHAGREKSRL